MHRAVKIDMTSYFHSRLSNLNEILPGEHPKKFGTPYLFLQPLKLATEKLVHNMSSGLPCQTQVLFR